MGTLPIIKGFRLRILPSENEHLRRFPVIVFVITLMIGIQVPMMSCSGGVNLARPYLFRDYEMLTAYNPQQHSSHGHLFQQQKSSSSFTESSEDGSSEEGEETQQYTAPLILDIDDPEVKARWMGLSEQSYEDEEDEEYYEDDEGQQPRSLSSTEFSSRSSQMQSSVENKPEKSSSSSSSSSNGKKSGDKPAGEESRGIMDNFSFNPFSYWQGESEDDQGQADELPQSDETPEYSYYPYAYDASPTDYYYDPSDQYQNDDQKKQAIMPHLVPMQYDPPKPKPKPKPVLKQKKPKPKPPTKPKAPKAKPKPKPHPPQMKPRPMKIKKKPQFTQQFHYQEFGKPDKLSIISEKLSKLNPFNYVQIQKPQIKITQIPGDDPPPPGMHHGPPPPHMKRRKPKRPHPPKRKPKPKPQPSMMQSMMNKIKPKPQQPKPKQKRPKKPQGEEPNPEFVMIFGEPNFGGFNSDDDGHPDYRDGQDEENDDDDDDDDDEEEDEEEEGDEDDEEDLPQVTSITHGELPSGEMTNGEASFSDDDQEEALMSNDDGEADAEQSNQPVEDDEGDYEDGVIGRVTSSNAGTNSNTDSETGQEDTDQREKSIKLTRLFGWRKKKRKRRPHKPVPARKPPHWKEYRPAPLIPETVTDGVSDAILKVVKHVGFLPEYDKIEKYGGHNKIKGKFTKTRPITLHHGLMTEVLRRRR